ncbi:DUF2116 family Zn-ribbon domain-containing protein [Flavimarina sp. Hel_I_48]|uniref:DUF2116 family Zn-ribbon domain-containing protein n=1 Tax=Flavimarina sp. Hel_I_48 TaxID=1392488 RepID=UPI0004DEDF98|nr:hypothetical protein [Flavimarina sp. Hel_I_48]
MRAGKFCPVCEAPVKGRSDKRFCSTKCKSMHQYETRQKKEAFYIKVDRQLKINRKVLKGFNKKGLSTLRKSDLYKEGFDPNFFTHYWKNKKGNVYLFVYEYGFLDLSKDGKDKYLLVTWQEYMNK